MTTDTGSPVGLAPDPGVAGGPGSTGTARRPAAPVPALRRRPAAGTPERSQAFAHLDLAALRAQRRVLQEEERKTLYWRRVVQARIDLFVAAGRGPRAADPRAGIERIRQALTDPARPAGRQVALGIGAVHGLPAAPDLSGLHRLLGPLDPAGSASEAAGLDADVRGTHLLRLSELESQLSTYRRILHEQIDGATAELIARYHEAPSRCLVALPLGPDRGAHEPGTPGTG